MRSMCVAAGAALVAVAGANANTITLDTGLLPSQQGWVFSSTGVHSSLVESDIFSTDGNILTSDSIGRANGGSPGDARSRYDLTGLITADATVEMNARMRILQSQVLQFNFGFLIGVSGAGKRMAFGFSTGTVTDANQTNRALNTTDWHDYRFVGDWAAGTYEMYVDGSLFRTGTLQSSANTYIEIGDGTGTANAHAEIASFSVTIPAPGAAAALLAAGALAARRRR